MADLNVRPHAALRVLTVSSFLPLLVAFPVIDLATAYLVGLLFGPSSYHPLGLPEAWDMRHVFVAGIISRAIGVAASLGAIIWARRTMALTPAWTRAAWIAFALNGVGLVEFTFGLVASGCAYNPQSPTGCTVGN